MGERNGEVLVDFKSPDGERITHVRSTLITSSIQTLKALGFIERYLRALPAPYHAEMLAPRAPGWIEEELAAIHYNACEDMALSAAELAKLSESVVTSVSNTLLAALTRGSRVADGTPWISLAQSERLFSRLNRGGAIRVVRRGPNEALVEVRGGTLYKIPYYASGHCAMLRVIVLLYAKSAEVRTLGTGDLEHRALISWS